MTRRDLALLARRLHTAVERGVRAALKDAAAVGASADQLAELERTTRERLTEEASLALETVQAEHQAEQERREAARRRAEAAHFTRTEL